MNFTITRNNPLNTEIVGPGVAYSVHSPGILRRRTTISRGDATIAEIDWHFFAADVLRMGGVEVRVADFLQRTGFFTSKRTFTIDGNTYTWRPSRSRLTLYFGTTPIASMEKHFLHAPTLQVSQAAGGILDTLIVSMIIMWRIREQQKRRRRQLGGGGDDGGGGGGGDGGGGC